MMKEKINIIKVAALDVGFGLYDVNICVKSECLQDFLNYIEQYKKEGECKNG